MRDLVRRVSPDGYRVGWFTRLYRRTAKEKITMPPSAQELMADAQKALRLGNPQLADELLAAALETPQPAAPAGPPPAAAASQPSTPPRNPQAIITDLFTHVVSRMGNPPALEALLRELDQAASPPPTE